MAEQFNYTQLDQTETSFQLVRTNPKLTGNVKINVDSTGNIYLDSIESSSELSQSRYKRFSIRDGRAHAANVYSFFNNTPDEIIFRLNRGVEPDTISSNYNNQYDFDYYYSGVYYFSNKFFNERFNMFAPLHLKRKLPKYFIILKIPDPINEPIDENESKYPFNDNDYLNNLLKNSTIVKTYDLGPNSKIGKYIREYLNSDNLPVSGLKVRFEEDTLTTWNGISTQSGVLSERGEYLSEFFKTGYPLKYFERYITEGFERNSIIYPYIFNLNFLFDDVTSDIYDFNRYIGLYVNDIEIDEFEFDLTRLVEDDTNLDNQIDTDVDPKSYQDDALTIINNDGVNIPYFNNNTDLRDIYSANTYTEYNNGSWQNITNSELFLTSVKDQNNNLHRINGVDVDKQLLNLDKGENGVEANHFYGPDSNFIVDEGFNTTQPGNSHTYIEILDELTHQSKIYLYHSLGSKKTSNNKSYDEITIINNYSQIPQGEYYWFYDEDNIYGGDIYYVNGAGLIDTISEAVAGIINQIKGPFQAYSINNFVIISTTLTGDYDSQFGIEYDPYFNNNLLIENQNITNQLVNFKGGTATDNNRLVIDSEYLTKIENNINNIVVKTINGWATIDKISTYIDIVSEDNIDENSAQTLNSFLGNIVLVLSNQETADVSNSQFNIKTLFKPKISLLSLFPIKDFDYDFYRSKYTKTPIWELYNYFYIPPEVNVLQPNTEYKVIGSGEIEVEGNRYDTADTSPGNNTFTVNNITSYSRVRGDVTVIYNDDDNDPIHDENEELDNFDGFFTLRDESIAQEQSNTPLNQYRDKMINGRLNTEYDYHRENFTQNFAYLSKLQPFICKWGLGKDVRDNPYRLNNDFVFGINNFAPNHYNKQQDAYNLSHEWYYIEADYSIIEQEPNLLQNNYNYFTEKLNLNKLLTDSTEFNNYFTFTPTDTSANELDQPQDRYSVIRYNPNSGLNETFFRGVKIRFKDVQNKDVLGPDDKPVFRTNSRRFNNYKFTVLLRPIQEDINSQQSPIEYRFIEHSEYDFIVLLIDFYIGDKSQIGNPDILNADTTTYISESDKINGEYRIEFDNNSVSNLNYTLLYSLAHKKHGTNRNYYSNIKLPFIINFANINNNAFKIHNYQDSVYPLDAKNTITNFNNENLIIAHNTNNDQDNFLIEAGSFSPINNLLQSATKNSVIFSLPNLGFIDNTLTPSIGSSLSLSIWQNLFVFKQLAGGKNYFANLLSQLSFAQIAEYINTYSNTIQYQSYNDSGKLADTDNYYTEIVQPNILDKQSEIVAAESEVIPSQFSDRSVVDFNYIRVQLNENPILFRYNGSYEPIFSDLFKFNSNFEFNYNNYEHINLANIKINPNAKNFGIISNLNFLKISDKNILKLENDEQFDPKFELLDEIPIDHKNFNIFRSNWDFGFHQKHINKSRFTPVAGTLRIEEDNNFIGKAIKLPESFNVYDFSTEVISDEDNINTQLTNEYESELLYREIEDSFEGIIDLRKAVTRYLINDGIDQKFIDYLIEQDQYIGKLTLTEYVSEYIRLNILELYRVNEILNFTKTQKQQSQNINITGLTQLNAANAGYERSKDVEINNLDRLIIYFNVNKNNEGLIEYNPIINIELI